MKILTKISIISGLGVAVIVIVYVLEFYLGLIKGLAGYLGFAGLFTLIIIMIIRGINNREPTTGLGGAGLGG